ncbi:endonuclease/exonuclease/phosphatase family protein [Paragemmobacter straminiformis]|uniref:Endonuclease/exonuclease/phosphatase family protein n=1 Tax=Paragemmobacter straminiformis TaxID=2045119 RepID=A0A842IBZ0_9RHOB|nr:endonuclease/exonuclease/phosphatase family protein [Gemmobacter straminiformis]MBC2837099.1 endonuclease/exonuclease/phosphatase family protein [Gemmobacter straminiformis]
MEPAAPAPRPLRLATYNVEWFNSLFDDAGNPQDDDGPSHRYGLSRARQLAALRTVFAALDADGIMVIEAPDTGTRRSTVTALERFAASAGLRTTKALTGFMSGTEQEIAFLYDPLRIAARHDPKGPPSPKRGAHGAPRFDGTFRYDLDADGVSEQIRFSKPPLEIALAIPGRDLRLIGVHAKSKAAHGYHSPAEGLRIAIDNRRKQLAECIWLRQRIDGHLAAGESLIVMGDLNDGPGLDEYEKLFGRSGVEVVLGTTLSPERRLFDPHASMELAQRIGLAPSTARFYVPTPDQWLEALLDFIMVSPDLAARGPHWRIWHPLNDRATAAIAGLPEALLDASDHFPVTLDLP